MEEDDDDEDDNDMHQSCPYQIRSAVKYLYWHVEEDIECEFCSELRVYLFRLQRQY